MTIETFTKDILPIFENTCMTVKGKYPMFTLVIIGEEHFQCATVETDHTNQFQGRFQLLGGDLIVQLEQQRISPPPRRPPKKLPVGDAVSE